MSVTVENLEKSMAKLTVEVPAEEFEKAMQQAYLKQKKDIGIPGFRKGKVPRAMIEKMYGPGVFYEEAANSILPTAYADAAKESGLDITSQPELDVTQIEKGKPFIFTATVAVKPDVVLGTYKGVEVPKIDVTVTDEDLEKEIKREQEKNARQVTMDDEPAAEGDTVTMDYEGRVGGETFEGGTAQGADLKLGSNTFIPGFEEQLVGVKAGDTKEVHVTFPEDYHAEELKGKDAVFTCSIIKVSRTELPELDDDFAQDVSEFDTMEEYKEDLRNKIRERREEDAKQSKRDNAVSSAARAAQIDIPKPMIDTRCDEMFNNFARQMAQQGMDIREYMKYTNSDSDMMREHFRLQAEMQVRNELVLEAVAKAEGIEATEEDIAKEVEDMAKAYGMETEKMQEMLTDEDKESIGRELALRKAMDFIADEAVEVEVPEEEKKDEAEPEAAEEPAAEEAADEQKEEE